MKYTISDTSITEIHETSGTIQNTDSTSAIEISNNANFEDCFVLFNGGKCNFTEKLYIRAYGGNVSQPIEVNVVPFVSLGNGAGSSSGDSDTVDDMLDSIFGGGSDTVPDDAVSSDEDFESMVV